MGVKFMYLSMVKKKKEIQSYFYMETHQIVFYGEILHLMFKKLGIILLYQT